jgi:GNAT superfamily N-acetyltransferase
MSDLDFQISEIRPDDLPSINTFITENWGSFFSVSRGKIINATKLPGFISIRDNKLIGLITYNIDGDNCEIVTLNSKLNNIGLGEKLINKVIETAKLRGCRRVWLITTNDNTKAIRFYQKRGFEWIAFHKDAIKESRKLKPEIPEIGDDGIEIKHEIEFEFLL